MGGIYRPHKWFAISLALYSLRAAAATTIATSAVFRICFIAHCMHVHVMQCLLVFVLKASRFRMQVSKQQQNIALLYDSDSRNQQKKKKKLAMGNGEEREKGGRSKRKDHNKCVTLSVSVFRATFLGP